MFVRRDVRALYLNAVCKKVYRDLFRTDAVAVVVVVPDLAHRDLGGFRRMLIVDGIAVDLRIFVFGNRILGDRVDDLDAAVAVLRNVGERVGPVAVFVRRDVRALYLNAVCKEMNRDLLGADTVLIVRILPILFDRDFRIVRDRLFGSPVVLLFQLLVGNVQFKGEIHPDVDVALAACNADHRLGVFAVSDLG